MEQAIKNKTRNYIINGIKNDIKLDVKKRFNTYFLRGTDRKSYTLKVTSRYLDEKLFIAFDVNPYMSNDEVKNTIEYTENNIKYEMADKLYNKYFNK
jgi:hypothetical protein